MMADNTWAPSRNRIAGAVIVAMFLIVASDIEPTAELAVAFAYLIFVSSLVIVGPTAFANMSRLVNQKG
jgi:hypothetical protein